MQPTKAFELDRDQDLLSIQAFIRCGRRMPIPCVSGGTPPYLNFGIDQRAEAN
jgi:hypothetical protein